MIIDIIFIIILIVGFLHGYQRGVVRTVFYTISIFIGMLAVVKFAPGVRSVLLQNFGASNGIHYLIAIVILFLLVLFFIRYLSKVLERFLTKVKINFINKIAGGLVLGFIGVLVFSSILWLIDQANVISEAAKLDSHSYSFLNSLPDFVYTKIKAMSPTFRNFLQSVLDSVRPQ